MQRPGYGVIVPQPAGREWRSVEGGRKVVRAEWSPSTERGRPLADGRSRGVLRGCCCKPWREAADHLPGYRMGKGGILGQLLTMAIVHEVRDHTEARAQQPAARTQESKTEPLTKKEAKQGFSNACKWMLIFGCVTFFAVTMNADGYMIKGLGDDAWLWVAGITLLLS